MKISSLVLSFCLFVVGLFTPAYAAEKITVDPNTPTAGAEANANENFWTADQRLAQKVAFEARREAVSSVLSRLSSQTSVMLNCGHNSKDWQVRDRKMIIFVKDMPLSDLMQSIARVMKFKWSRSEINGIYAYRLIMDRKAVIEAEAEAARAEEMYNKEQQRKREDFANSLKSLSELNSADLAQLREDNPMSYAVAASGMADSLNKLFSVVPGARDAFTSAGEISIDTNLGSTQAQAAMRGIAQAIARMCPDPSSMPGAGQFASDPGLLKSIRLCPSEPDNGSGAFLDRFTLGEIAITYSNGNGQSESEFGFLVMDPDSSLGKGMGGMLAKMLDAGPNNAVSNGLSINIDPKEMDKIIFGEPIVTHEEKLESNEDLDFSKIKTTGSVIEQYIDQLAKFAEITRLSVVSDCFATSHPLSMSKTQPAGFLASLELLDEYNWWKRGSTIELRNRRWFRNRSLEIPDAWLEKWRQSAKKSGTLGIDDLADMAVLVGEKPQYDMNIAGDPVLDINWMKMDFQFNLQFLRFYATLNTQQRSQVYTSEGLDLNTLSLSQKQAANAASIWWNPNSPFIIAGTRKKAGEKQLQYTFTEGGKFNIGIKTPQY